MGLIDRRRLCLVLSWLAIAAVYLFFVSPGVSRPIIGWEGYTWSVAEDIFLRGPQAVKYLYLPPFYTSLIAFSFKLFGIGEASARLVGVFCVLINSIVIYFLIKEITRNSRESFWAYLIALVMFMFAPAVIQGSLVIDHPDTHLFMLVVSLFYLSLFKTQNMPLSWRIPVLGLICGLCVGIKITTAMALLIALPLSYLFTRSIKNNGKLLAGVLLSGIIFFAAGWLAWCYLTIGVERFHEPFSYYSLAARESFFIRPLEKISSIGLDLFRITLWFSPLFMILGGLAVYDSLKKYDQDQGSKKAVQLAFFAIVVFSGYLLSNATFSSFPKYIITIFPMICCLAGKYIYDNLSRHLDVKKHIGFLFLAVAAGIIYYAATVDDLIYQIFILRNAQFAGRMFFFLKQLIISHFFYIALPVIVICSSVFLIKIRLTGRFILGVFIALCAGNLETSFIQSRARYSVNYAYGAGGLDSLVEFVENNPDLEVYSTTEGLISNLKKTRFKQIYPIAFSNPREFLIFLEMQKPRGVLYGLPVNTISQLKGIINDSSVRNYLGLYYEEKKFGSYSLLIRKRGS